MTDNNVSSEESSGGVQKPKPMSMESSYAIDMDCYLTIGWDTATEEVLFQVEMPADASLALAFGGSDLARCDMLLFQSHMDGPELKDCYYEEGNDDFIDAQQDWITEISDYGSRHHKLFTTRRALDTGDDEDFAFQLDRQMTLGIQFDRNGSNFEPHSFDQKETLLLLSDGQACKSWDSLLDLRRVHVYEAHGIWMFFAWMPLGYLLLATKRYYKGNWKLYHIVHILVGMVTLVVTIWQTLEISMKYGFGWTDDPHSILGTICIVATVIATLSGGLAAAYMRFYNGDKDWQSTETATNIGKFHRWVSYFVLFYANVILLGGTITYCLTYLKESKYIPFGVLSFLFFLNLVLVSEYVHRKVARSENAAKQYINEHELAIRTGNKGSTDVKMYTAQQVDIGVEQGQKLVILDNLILNLNGYERQHPGGKFTLIKNLGRDISKFYYGGYALVQKEGAYGVHAHTEASRAIVKQMIVGWMQGQEEVEDISCTVLCRYHLNPATATFVMNSQDNRITNHWRNWFSDVQMIGKHFLVYSQAVRDVKRHYTICNVMIPDNYNELILLTEQIIKGDPVNCNTRLFGDNDQSSICVTVKNYRAPSGVSTQLFAATTEEDLPSAILPTMQSERGLLDNPPDAEDWSPIKSPMPKQVARSQDVFFVKGPMGKGLQIEERGIHIAFCAGTGVLVYLDLVGHLILRNSLPFIKHNSAADKLTPQGSMQFPSNFSDYQRPKSTNGAGSGEKKNKDDDYFPEENYSYLSDHFQFHLYVSFQNEENSIGLELCQALLDLNKKLRLNNFKLIVRYSEPKKDPDSDKVVKPRRWDKNYIAEELYPNRGKMARIWVCGPPVMNQCFDQSLEDLQEKLQLRSNQIEIM